MRTVSVPDAARRLGVSRQRVGQLVRAGKLVGVTEPRPVLVGIDADSLAALAAQDRSRHDPRKATAE